MKIDAIVYTSKTGFTCQYAQMLGCKLSLPVYPLKEAVLHLQRGSSIMYLGCLHASHVKDFSVATKHFTICAVVGVGLCDTGTMISEVRKASAIPEEVPLFTLQGGFNRSAVKGMDSLMLSMLIKGLSSQKQRTEQDERMLQLLSQDANYVNEENLRDVLKWYKEKEVCFQGH